MYCPSLILIGARIILGICLSNTSSYYILAPTGWQDISTRGDILISFEKNIKFSYQIELFSGTF